MLNSKNLIHFNTHFTSRIKKIYNLKNINDLIDLGDNNLVNNTSDNQYYECVGKIIFIEDNMLRVLIHDKNIIFTYKEIKFELFQNINIKIYKIKLESNPFRIIINDMSDFF